MAMSFKEFVAASSAELCGDRLIVGYGSERKFVGAITEGTFTLNEAGQELLTELEAPKKPGRPKADAPAE